MFHLHTLLYDTQSRMHSRLHNSQMALHCLQAGQQSGFPRDVLPVQLYRMVRRSSDLDIEMIGVCTDICVVSNALILKALYPEATVRVDAGCCAGVTPEAHAAALATMRSCQVDIIDK